MKRILRFARRALSLMLCLAMVMTTMFFFDIGVTESDAKVSINSQNLDKIVFYVPEVIYLYPNAHSWKSNTTSNFQYYVQDNVEQMISNGVLDFSKSPTISKTPDTTGKIYFACDQNFEINATMTYKFVDSNGNKLPESAGGIVNWSGYQDHRNYSGRNYDYIEFNGTSPSLAANVSGCYIEWELIYDITETGERKSVYAYTYVYKPYMVPVGAASRAEETHNDSVFSQHATWISGAHNFTRYDTAHGNETATAMAPKFASGEDNYGLLGFLSSQPIGYTDEAGTATNTGVKANVTADRNVAGSANSVFYIVVNQALCMPYTEINHILILQQEAALFPDGLAVPVIPTQCR